MDFIKLFFLGFIIDGKPRLFSVSLCLAFAVVLDMYDFNPKHLIVSLLMWIAGICLFYFFRITFGMSIFLLNLILVSTWFFSHFNDKLVYSIQKIGIILLIIWLLETLVNYREIKRRK
jgi:hypothetical protein